MRRTLQHAAILFIVLGGTIAAVATGRAAEPITGVRGDADCDGQVTAVDARYQLAYSVALTNFLPCPVEADVTQRGGVTPVDALLVLQDVAGLIDLEDYDPYYKL